MESITQVLREEFDVILRMLDALEAIARLMLAGETIPLQARNDPQEFLAKKIQPAAEVRQEFGGDFCGPGTPGLRVFSIAAFAFSGSTQES